MNTDDVSIDRQTWSRFVRVVRNLSASDAGRKVALLFGLLVLLMLGVNGLNVLGSYVGRDFMTAIEHRDLDGFVWQAAVYVGVFAAATVTAVFYRFTEERLGLLWREWLTRRLVATYLEHPTYYRLNDRLAVNGEVLNPDQRIADDVKAFTTTTLSFALMALNGAFTVAAFSGVMWTISPLLFVVTVLYAAFGSYMTFVLGRPLIGLNYAQLDKEANFRSDLIHVRENAESVALLRREGRLRGRILRHFDELAANFRKIILVNRNLGFFTTGYNYLIQIIPALVVAPMFMRGEVEFGVITQSAMAFTHLLGAFSLVVTQFQSISSFAAVIARLGALVEGMEQAQTETVGGIAVRGGDTGLVYEKLTLRAPGNGHALVENLSIAIPAGVRVLVAGPSETASVALFRATAGIWDSGSGGVIRPDLDRIMFLPERPYLPPGTLRDLLLRSGQERTITDDYIYATLAILHLESVVERAGGLDVEQDWNSLLSLSEQQRVAFARLFIAAPKFALLDRLSSALDAEQVAHLLGLLNERSITYVHFGEPGEPLHFYDAVLELAGNGHWAWKPIAAESVRKASSNA
jgi:putative ATP-binding cassette transporter